MIATTPTAARNFVEFTDDLPVDDQATYAWPISSGF